MIDLRHEGIEPESVRASLQQAWNDHHHTRDQTWKALQMELVIVAGLIAISWQIQNMHIILITSLLALILAVCGIQITIRHRNRVECLKFEHIKNCSQALGMMRDGLICKTGIPKEIAFWHAFDPRKANTSLFILRMHVAVFIVAIVYFAWALNARIVDP